MIGHLNDFLRPLVLMLPYMTGYVNTIKDGAFWDCSRIGGGGGKKDPLPKVCHTDPTTKKHGIVISYLKKIQKAFK